MKIEESMKTRAPAGRRSSLKQRVVLGQRLSKDTAGGREAVPGPRDHAAGVTGLPLPGQMALQGLADDLADLLVLPDGLELRAPEEVLVEQRAHFSAGHVMMIA